MASNYYYLIAGLPELTLDFESSGFDFDSLLYKITANSTLKEKRYIKWLVFGIKESNLKNHFYNKVCKSDNNFLRTYFCFDLDLRNILAAYAARKESIDPSQYLIGDNHLVDILKTQKNIDSSISLYSETTATIVKILENQNILEREKAIDDLRWETAGEAVIYSLFDIDYILAFIIKASIVKRWSLLSKERGAVLFRQFVEEVRGTFKLKDN